MQVSVEATEGLERKMTVEVPAERIEAEVEERLKSVARTARIDGFRPGKAPFKVVKRQYGGRVRDEVVGDVIQSTFGEAVTEQKLRLAGAPTIDEADEAGGALKYTATFEVYPEITIAPMNEVSIERPVAEVSDADVDAMIEKLRKQRVTWKAVERAAADGDRVTADFKGFVDGEAFAGGSAEKTPIVLGSGGMIPGFEEQIVGISAGEERTIEVTFPEDYRAEQLAGKAAKFEIKAHTVEEPVLPELDDEFAASMQIKEGGVEGLRAEVRGNMERELRQAVKGKLKNAVMDAVLENNPVDLPKAMIEQEVNALHADAQRYNQGGGFSLPRELFEEQAKKRVALGLLIMEIVKANEIKADEQRVREAVEELAASYEDPSEVVNWYYSNREYLSRIESSVLEDQVVDWVLEQAKVSDKGLSFEEVMGANA